MTRSDKVFILTRYRDGLTATLCIEEDNHRPLSMTEQVELTKEVKRINFEIRKLKTFEQWERKRSARILPPA